MDTQFFQYWKECTLWAAEAIWNNLWDGKTFIVFLFFWVIPLVKKCNDLGWAPATWMFFERALAAVKALLWPAIVLAAVFVFLIFFVAPIQKYKELQAQYQLLRDESTKPQPVVKDEESRKIIDDLRQKLNGRDIEIQELKRLHDRAEDAANRKASENAALNNKLRDLQSKMDDKARRKAIREQLGQFLEEGEVLLRRCLTQVKDPPPVKEADEWLNKTYTYLKLELGSSEATQFLHPPLGPPGRSFTVPQDHDRLANALDRYLNALRAIIGQSTS
jgi:hypothetical protein